VAAERGGRTTNAHLLSKYATMRKATDT